LAASGGQQAGTAIFGSSGGAALWAGTAASYVNLNPTGYDGSVANATDGQYQGGGATAVPNGPQHAAIWHGTAASFVDLHPFGGSAGNSVVNGMALGQQVGYVYEPGLGTHGAVWSGTAQSFLDLNPCPGLVSQLLGTSGHAQVGRSNVPGSSFPHAGIWFGTASSFVDLHSFLPPGYSMSVAYSVAEAPDGRIFVGGTANRPDGTYGAFLWVYAPSPGAANLLVIAGALAARRRRVERLPVA
jgi:hypothetical protein